MRRLLVFLFGIFSYLFGLSALTGWILVLIPIVRFHDGPFEVEGFMSQLAMCFGLISLFAVQHTIMARPWFKAWQAHLFPKAMERPIFVFMTALVVWPMLILWPVMPEQIWNIESSGFRTLIYGIGAAGWVYLLAASFAINHFELFGLQQVYYYFRGIPEPSVPFTERWMYRFDRHPIMTGVLIGTWASPTMAMDQFILSILMTVYIVIGVSIEERDLIATWGEGYLRYKKRVGSLVPKIF